MFILFLIAYSYVVLFDFRPNMGLIEKFVLVWIVSSALGEINEVCFENLKTVNFKSSLTFQFFGEDAATMKGKYRDWSGSVWNKFDILSFLIALIGFGFRCFPQTFHWGRIVYAVNSNVHFLRIFRIYHVSYSLGPKLVILNRMVRKENYFSFFYNCKSSFL